jgi:hypothetical protein
VLAITVVSYSSYFPMVNDLTYCNPNSVRAQYSTSDRLMSSHDSSASDGSVPLHHQTFEVSISATYPSQSETPPDKEKFLDKREEETRVFLRGRLSLVTSLSKSQVHY